jgi:hypothetical protein
MAFSPALSRLIPTLLLATSLGALTAAAAVADGPGGDRPAPRREREIVEVRLPDGRLVLLDTAPDGSVRVIDSSSAVTPVRTTPAPATATEPPLQPDALARLVRNALEAAAESGLDLEALAPVVERYLLALRNAPPVPPVPPLPPAAPDAAPRPPPSALVEFVSLERWLEQWLGRVDGGDAALPREREGAGAARHVRRADPSASRCPVVRWFEGGADVPMAGLRDALVAQGWDAHRLQAWLTQQILARLLQGAGGPVRHADGPPPWSGGRMGGQGRLHGGPHRSPPGPWGPPPRAGGSCPSCGCPTDRCPSCDGRTGQGRLPTGEAGGMWWEPGSTGRGTSTSTSVRTVVLYDDGNGWRVLESGGAGPDGESCERCGGHRAAGAQAVRAPEAAAPAPSPAPRIRVLRRVIEVEPDHGD